MHLLCTCLLADRGACAAGSQLPAEGLNPSLGWGQGQHPEKSGAAHSTARPSKLPSLTWSYIKAALKCCPSLPPKLKFGRSWRTASQLESFKNYLFVSKFAFQPKHPIFGTLIVVVSLTVPLISPGWVPMISEQICSVTSPPLWAGGFVSICSTLCTSRQSQLLVFASVIFWEASRLQEAPWAPSVCWLDGGIIISLSKMYCHWLLPVCALQPFPIAQFPSLEQCCLCPCCSCYLSLLTQVCASSPCPQDTPISLTFWCTGEMCDLEFTPNAGAASWWGWPCQTHRTDFTAHESNLAIPRITKTKKEV